MCDEYFKWRNNTVRVAGIVFSMIFVSVFFIYMCLVGMAKKRRLAAQAPIFDFDEGNTDILRKTSELPDLQPPPAYDVLQEPPPPTYSSLLRSQ
ncbi:resistance to Congo red protein [Caenorhabditis elegans]|uniref:Uncharacterized protein n=1 Tax=Caenorhabditis elegans TaxID=6239 RepID=Q7YTJ9_CAEEL|nr:Uncharacterized protein CELE_T26E3.10 [Caenorhabditis elegans]CAE17954.1 Uncharacterized protein CELE_T26E3.10 [Caenorhabditis elegans]|eukprot:NP_001021641.1 Uncharacterized protein CELE_T26E3.10 [Caenorhabditis elegans]